MTNFYHLHNHIEIYYTNIIIIGIPINLENFFLFIKSLNWYRNIILN